jgi:hypothetical protein
MSRMRFRKLRIAWSVAWGVVAVLLVVLWVRSYWWIDDVYRHYHPTHGLGAISQEGSLIFFWGPHNDVPLFSPLGFPGPPPTWDYDYYPVYDPSSPIAFPFEFAVRSDMIGFPTWFGAAVCAGAGMAPWPNYIPRRFSLRTLLIATTLVAVALGLIAWAAK